MKIYPLHPKIHAPSWASIVSYVATLLFGAAILVQIPRMFYDWWVGSHREEVPMRVIGIEDTVGHGGIVTYSCRAPSGEELQTPISTRELEKYSVGQETTGKVFPYILGTICVPREHNNGPLGGVIILSLLFLMFGSAFFVEGLKVRQLFIMRRVLQTGTPGQGKLLDIKEEKSKRLRWRLATYEYTTPTGEVVQGTVRFRAELSNQWSFMIHRNKLMAGATPEVGQGVKVMFDAERPKQHVVIDLGRA